MGRKYLPHVPDIECDGDVYFTGIEDITISQGTEIDLRANVHAYDGNDNEIQFVVSPSEIDECSVGVYDITYSAIGLNRTMLPYFPNSKNELEDYPSECETSEKTAHRSVTIEAVSAPVIYGIADIEVTAPYTLDTLQGVYAIDGNSNPVAVTASPSGSVEYTSEGTYSVVYTAVDECGNTTTETRIVTVESMICFEMTFQLFPPLMPISHRYDLVNTLRNNCDCIFVHDVVCHPGLKDAIDELECHTDRYGFTPTVLYHSNVYFDATAEELQRGYKDIEYIITATTADNVTVTNTFTYRCIL